MKKILITACLIAIGSATNAETYCDRKLEGLKDYALLIKYESLPAEQKGNFLAQLPSEKRITVTSLQAGHGLGAALAGAFGANNIKSTTEIFNKDLSEFKKECGFMLQ